ncbi:MAG TPA: BlaI/MecI/CopY family transcriptional regulator [Cryptosporangiaceae bacterium]|nr:BlaI/MecI/CopY family transcriptional regulator [Cryptosporangiaceae bacterium]
MARLGELERAVMEVLWSADGSRTAREVADALTDRELAKTTVLTVLSRLEHKGRVARNRDGWAHTYSPTASREDYIAELMTEALGDASDRTAALIRFAGRVSPAEAVALSAALDDALRRSSRTSG